MNRIRAIVHLSCRGYRGVDRSRRSTEKVKREIQMVQPHMPVEQFEMNEEDDPDDLDAYESNFSTVGEFNEMHDRELAIRKLKLKNQIVKRKYFKTTEPSTLTLGEKHQIQNLHTQDPEEWSVDKLCESFPASREAIVKVLRAKWWPKSTKTIENYEKMVKNNWDLFKRGQLPVEPELRAHLEKFKNRQIKIMDTKEMEKFLKPQPVFPKPKSTMFSDIVKGYVNEEKPKNDEKSVTIQETAQSKIPAKQLASGSKIIDKISKVKKPKSMTFDMFVQSHVDGVQTNKMTPVDRVLLDEHKRQQSEAYKVDTLVLESKNAVTASKKLEQIIERKYEKLEVVESKREPQPKVIDEHTLDTGIIARHKKEGSNDDYPEFIRIPHKSRKRGATYKVEDRYYDDDGAFLYRVIGLKV